MPINKTSAEYKYKESKINLLQLKQNRLKKNIQDITKNTANNVITINKSINQKIETYKQTQSGKKAGLTNKINTQKKEIVDIKTQLLSNPTNIKLVI